jgi:hypothetical protein
MAKLSRINCDQCGRLFTKETRYVTRSEKLGRKNYCTRLCLGVANYKNLPTDWNGSEKNKEQLKLVCNNRRDEYSLFKPILNSCRRRNKECDLDLHYLKKLWEDQQGKCPITGVELQLKQSYNKNYQASLDRIDSSKGYIKGNIQWVHKHVNKMKSNKSDYEFLNWCRKCYLHSLNN